MTKTKRQKEIYAELKRLERLRAMYARGLCLGYYDKFMPRKSSKREKRLLREYWAIQAMKGDVKNGCAVV